MAPLSVPRTAEDLTAGWLTAALRHVGVLREARVTRVARTALGVESGLTSEVVRLRLTYSADASGAPASLVAKLASADPAVRAPASPGR